MTFRKAMMAAVLAGGLAWPAAAQKKPAAAAPRTTATPARPAGTSKSWKQLTYPKLGEVKLPPVQRFTLSNGMKLFLVEDHRLPLVDGVALVRTGSRWEPAEKVGLSSMAGQVMRTGGTKSKTGDQLDEQLEARAASVESSVGESSGSVSFSCLKGDEDQALAVFADVLMNPEFRQDKIDLAKTLARTNISRRNDNVGGIAGREFRKLLFGAGSPYARQTEYYTIDAIARGDLASFHQRYYHPNNILLAVWGDFQPSEMKAKIEKIFAGWKGAPLNLPPLPPVDTRPRASLNLVRKEDVTQTNLRVGHLGNRFDDPDYFALDVMAEILCAGEFSSRVTKHIRTEMGLAYDAGGHWAPGYDHPGAFFIYVDTKSETTVRALEAILKEVRDIRERPVSDEELRQAKESILSAFVFNFQNVGQIVNRLMTYDYYGYPADFLEKYKTNVEKVTAADVLRVAQKHLEPDHLVILAVGRDKDFDKPLSQLAYAGGKVNLLDISIPESKPAAQAGNASPQAADPAALEKGRAVLAAAQKFAGGLEKLRAVKDIETHSKADANTPQGPVELSVHSVTVFPNVSRSEVATPIGDIINFFDGATGWSQPPGGGAKELSEAQKKDSRSALFRNLQNLLRNEGDARVVWEKREGENEVLLISRDDASVRLYVDGSGKVTKAAYRGSTFAGAGDVEQTYSDYREVSGLQLPHKLVMTLNGQKILEGEVTEIKVNTGADPARLGQKPQ